MLVNLKTIFFIIHFLCVFCMGLDGDGWPGHYPRHHFPRLHGWLKLHVEPADWMTARKNCHNEGALLASPWTDEFTTSLTHIISLNELVQDESLPVLYTGAQVSFSEGVYTDVQGEPIISEEPCNLKRNCIVLFANGALGQVGCEQQLPYVCYARNVSATVELHCGETTPGYKLDNRTGHCYQFNDVGKTWDEARRRCQEGDGDLVVINSQEEADFLKEIYAQYTTLYYTYDGSYVFVGFQDTGVGSWKTIHGETLEEAGYARWGKGEPDNFQSDWPPEVMNMRQACGAMHRDGHLSDRWCMTNQAFICEKIATKKMH